MCPPFFISRGSPLVAVQMKSSGGIYRTTVFPEHTTKIYLKNLGMQVSLKAGTGTVHDGIMESQIQQA